MFFKDITEKSKKKAIDEQTDGQVLKTHDKSFKLSELIQCLNTTGLEYHTETYDSVVLV